MNKAQNYQTLLELLSEAITVANQIHATGDQRMLHAKGQIISAVAQFNTQAANQLRGEAHTRTRPQYQEVKASRFNTTPPARKAVSSVSSTLKKKQPAKVAAPVESDPEQQIKKAEEKLKAAENVGQISEEPSDALFKKIAGTTTHNIVKDYGTETIQALLDNLGVEYDDDKKPMQLAAMLRKECQDKVKE